MPGREGRVADVLLQVCVHGQMFHLERTDSIRRCQIEVATHHKNAHGSVVGHQSGKGVKHVGDAEPEFAWIPEVVVVPVTRDVRVLLVVQVRAEVERAVHVGIKDGDDGGTFYAGSVGSVFGCERVESRGGVARILTPGDEAGVAEEQGFKFRGLQTQMRFHPHSCGDAGKLLELRGDGLLFGRREVASLKQSGRVWACGVTLHGLKPEIKLCGCARHAVVVPGGGCEGGELQDVSVVRARYARRAVWEVIPVQEAAICNDAVQIDTVFF